MDIPYTIEARPDTGLYNAKVGIWLFLASEVMLFGALFSAYALLRMVLRSLFGHVIQGIRASEIRMRALGYPVFRYKLVAFVLAGALAGFAGYLNAAQFGSVNPEFFGWQLSGTVLMMVILGGLGTLYGPILGALALTLLQDVLGDLTKHWLLPMGLFIIVAVLLLPQGIGGLAHTWRKPAPEAVDD